MCKEDGTLLRGLGRKLPEDIVEQTLFEAELAELPAVFYAGRSQPFGYLFISVEVDAHPPVCQEFDPV